ncbi:4'-phosphopantetheinyl transferase family protein [Larkinella insperata]|uniref:4'-phosphopantetheinyl transferase family protein n=1 Tax=Larkinella insperata TaxID=332158 RepID=A0ABW3QM08_9BACT|nr:4'-phosphopantetheinyl transferase superfamily protein [Larkinella insperata]
MRSARVVYDTIPTVTWEPLWERLSSSDLVIFRIELVRFTTFISTFSTWLSTDEHHRAQRYFHEKDRNRFVITRGILRLILGRYTHRNPSDIQFGSQGKKPVLRADDNWQYNVSHSGNWALIAVSAQPVGVDIEKIDDAFRFQDLLPETFGLADQLYLQRHPDARPLFYHWWTRKEALVKATGQGIDDYFKEIPARDGTHEVQECVLGQRGHWTARNFEVTEGYTAAVAYESADRHPRFVEVTPELLPLLKAV